LRLRRIDIAHGVGREKNQEIESAIPGLIDIKQKNMIVFLDYYQAKKIATGGSEADAGNDRRQMELADAALAVDRLREGRGI
jgi:hypothetical protein